MQNFMQALGIEEQINREAALKFADACAKQMLRVMGKISQINEQRAASQPRQSARRSGLFSGKGSRKMQESLQPAEKARKWSTNADLFNEADAIYRQMHTRY
jgi:hypothetical protein